MSTQQFEHIKRIRRAYRGDSELSKANQNNAIRMLAEDLYNKHTHFIFELIQNAEDNAYDKNGIYPPYISFQLTKTDPTCTLGSNGALVIRNNEIGFNSKNVDAICAVGATTKEKKQGYIGEKGIGFKSVFRVTGNPHIFSNGYHFSLPESDEETGLGYVVPLWIDLPPKDLDLSETHIILPLTKKDFGYEVIEEMLQDIEPEIILFLSTLQEIQIKTDTGDEFTILKDNSAMPEVQIVVEGKKQGIEFSNSDGFLVCTERFDKPENIHHEKREGIENRKVTIGFPLNENSTAVGKIFAYLPVRSGTGFPFLINADFILPSSREDIQDVPWNRHWLMFCVANLVAMKLLPLLKERALLNVSVLEVLAGELNNLAEDEGNLFYPIFSSLRRAIMREELLPTNDGTFVSAQKAVLTRSDAVRNLLTQDQLAMLLRPDLNHDVRFKWLSAEVTLDRTPALRRYIMDSLEIEEVTPDMFARRLSKEFLSMQTDEWFVKFYKFLFYQPALWRSGIGVLRTKPILRLQDGIQVDPPQEGFSPTAYLSVGRDADISLPVVKWEISQDEDAYKFLKALGVQECDIVAEVIGTILPKYRQKASTVSNIEHLRDLTNIERAYKTDSQEKKTQLKRALQETPFIRAEKPDTDGNFYFKPDQLYFSTEELRLYFAGNPSFNFIDLGFYPKSDRALFVDLGVLDSVGIQRKKADASGYVCIVEERANYTRGLNGFDVSINVDGLKHALSTPTPEKSAFIWNHIVLPNADCISGRVQKSTRKNYGNSSFKDVLSYYFGDLLVNNAWLPDIDGNMHNPSEITLDDLPDVFKKDERSAKMLDMPVSKARIIDIVAPGLGVSADVLSLMIDAPPETINQIRSILQSSPESDFVHPPPPQDTLFPTRSVSNPERRTERTLVELARAPNQKYVEKLRSVRASKGEIDPKTWLSAQYTNDDGEMVCQICQDEMPFKYRGENYYFEAVEMLKGHFTKEYEAQFLALCLECAPKYRTFVKQVPEAMNTLKKRLMDSDNTNDFEVPLTLDGYDTSLRFVERHWLDIKTILSFYDQQSEQTVEKAESDEQQPKQAIETNEPEKKKVEPKQVPSSQSVEKKENWDADQILDRFFAQPIYFATYTGRQNLSQVKTREHDLTGVDANGNKITLAKHEILFAFPQEKMPTIKPHVHIRRSLKNQNLQPVEVYNNPFQIANKLLRQVKKNKSQVKVVTRAGYVLNGWIEYFDKSVLYMRVGEKVVIVYRHGLYGFTIEE